MNRNEFIQRIMNDDRIQSISIEITKDSPKTINFEVYVDGSIDDPVVIYYNGEIASNQCEDHIALNDTIPESEFFILPMTISEDMKKMFREIEKKPVPVKIEESTPSNSSKPKTQNKKK